MESDKEWANEEIRIANKYNKGLFESEYNASNYNLLEIYNYIVNNIESCNELTLLIKLLNTEILTPIKETDEFCHYWNYSNNRDNCKRDYKLVRYKINNEYKYKYYYHIKYHIDGPVSSYIDGKIHDVINEYFPVKFPFNPSIIHVYIKSRYSYDETKYIWKLILLSKENDTSFIQLDKCYCDNEIITEEEYNKYINQWK